MAAVDGNMAPANEADLGVIQLTTEQGGHSREHQGKGISCKKTHIHVHGVMVERRAQFTQADLHTRSGERGSGPGR